MNPTQVEDSPGANTVFRRRAVTAVVIAALVAGLLLLGAATLDVILLVFAGLLLAVALRGLTDLLRRHTPLPDKAAFAVVLVGLLLLIGAGVGAMAPNLAAELDQLAETLPDAVQQIEDGLRRYEWGRQLVNNAPPVDRILARGGDIIAAVTGVATNIISALGTALVLLFIGIFLAIDPGLYVNGLLDLIPDNRRDRIHAVLSTMFTKLAQWLITRFISMVVTGILAAIGLLLLGVPYVLTLSILEGLSAFVPALGPLLAAIPAILVGLTQSPATALQVAVLYLIVQGIDNYIVSPIVAQKMISLPPALIIIPQLFLGALAGLPGVILAAPLTVVLMVAVRMLYIEDVLGKKRE
ncbi:MAG: AI-2E family transporter [Chloroflexi bacterium]|nr:AI-2E family transporter [Chloroflexota bacterium]